MPARAPVARRRGRQTAARRRCPPVGPPWPRRSRGRSPGRSRGPSARSLWPSAPRPAERRRCATACVAAARRRRLARKHAGALVGAPVVAQPNLGRQLAHQSQLALAKAARLLPAKQAPRHARCPPHRLEILEALRLFDEAAGVEAEGGRRLTHGARVVPREERGEVCGLQAEERIQQCRHTRERDDTRAVVLAVEGQAERGGRIVLRQRPHQPHQPGLLQEADAGRVPEAAGGTLEQVKRERERDDCREEVLQQRHTDAARVLDPVRLAGQQRALRQRLLQRGRHLRHGGHALGHARQPDGP
eukprot:scaffold4107_cov95-Isochrysis_galbana.AAC.10